ncbi:hypothetical protein PENTCL1PPCAC_13500, partial [Pristionchus entomophagus]
RVFLVLFLLFSSSSAFKFLCYSNRFASSHVNYVGKLSDALVDAGHEVILLSPIMDTHVRGSGSVKARVIEIPQSDAGRLYEAGMNGDVMDEFWRSTQSWKTLRAWEATFDLLAAQCNYTINYPGLIETLRAEKIDVGFGESTDWCIAGLFHLVGIEKFAITESLAIKDGFAPISQVPNAPAYVPSFMGGSYSDEMTFIHRAENFFYFLFQFRSNFLATDMFQNVFEQHSPGFPDIVDLLANNSLYFINSEPLVDFPKPSAARVIDLGGIAVSSAHSKLDEKWKSVFDLRPRTVLISFGTVARAWAMPEAYKEQIREAVRAFPDTTFIWKYEMAEHNVSQGIANLIEATWVPQRAMLTDPRLSAFVTHCGQGSTTEANYAGVPLIVVPVMLDQIRTAHQVARNGVGIKMDKTELGTPKKIESAIREVLENPEYRSHARKLASMLRDKPFTAREIFVKNMKFLAKHGPLRQLDHYGRHLNIFQYYLLDVIGAMVLSMGLIIALAVLIVCKVVSIIASCMLLKKKQD